MYEIFSFTLTKVFTSSLFSCKQLKVIYKICKKTQIKDKLNFNYNLNCVISFQ